MANVQLTSEQLVKAYRSVCSIRKFGERVHKEFTIGQIRGFVHLYASTHRGHCHSIEEGAES
ncbi:MAG: hypothetical protein A3F74_11900 [Betaproteobacteria bacterium RIFCSPLOWO2_12_FULL_62_58]|nr:MAG: hypothetical protein A3F74_11900 [Betaproteobacteria bacterium RIFCSPLOWO2_12_FULL_62_58]